MSRDRRFLHDNETRALKVARNALGGDRGHALIGLVNTLSAFEPQREGDRTREVARIGGLSLSSMTARDTRAREHFKNEIESLSRL
jgi:hypothetical protein